MNFFPLCKDLPTVFTCYKAVTCFTVCFSDPFTGGIVSVNDFYDAANKSKCIILGKNVLRTVKVRYSCFNSRMNKTCAWSSQEVCEVLPLWVCLLSWHVLLHTTFNIVPFCCYRCLPLTVPFLETFLQTFSCHFCSCLLFYL